LMDSTRRLWRHLDSGQRRSAELVLVQTFGRRSGAWLGQIRKDIYIKNIEADDEPSGSRPLVELSEWLLDQKIELPQLGITGEPPDPPKRVNEDHFDDAAEGERL
ncbi:MAG: hypothetical protein WCH39_26050, partial [Schlesneria sp.]